MTASEKSPVVAPDVTEVIGGYDFEWQDSGIKVECRRLCLHSGDLKGELIISVKGKGQTPAHLHQATFNFSSSSSRDRIAKTLNERLNWDWQAVLEQVCVKTLMRFRKGAPVIELNPFDSEIKPPEYLLYPFIIKNYPTVIFGDPGSAKSLISQVINICIMLPWADNPMGWRVTNKATKTLYLDWETDEDTFKWTCKTICEGMNIPAVFPNYRRCSIPLYQDIEQIAGYVQEYGIEFLFIDSLGMAVGGDLNNTEPALNFWGAWRKLKTTSLILAHTAKNEEKRKSIYGNVYYTAEARSIWETKKTSEVDSDDIDVMLYNRKSPPFSKLYKPMGFHIDFEGEGEIKDKAILSYRDPIDVQEFKAMLPASSRLLDYLKSGAKSREDIISYLDIDSNLYYVTKSRLLKRHQIVELKDGRLGLYCEEKLF